MAIMTAVTDSAEGALALSAAADEARRFGTELIVLNLRLSELEPGMLPTDIPTKVLERTPDLDQAECVFAALDEHEGRVERLVIGVKRRSPVGKAMLGSLSQDLLLEVDVPVLAVKLPPRSRRAFTTEAATG
jgi:hypothetical protein